MRQRAEIEDRRVVARRLFDALCTQHPDKYIYLIQLLIFDKHSNIRMGDRPVARRRRREVCGAAFA